MGILPKDLDDFIQTIDTLKNLKTGSIFSHFAKAYDQESSLQQKRIFESLEHTYPTHLLSSKSHFSHIEKDHSLMRVGIGLYGYVFYQPDRNNQLQPVLSLKSRIEMIKTIPANTPIGYDHTYVTKRETTIAVLPIGYAEGLPYELSNEGSVIINDHKVPILGKLSMNYTVVDITDIPNCTKNDHAIFIGQSKSHSITFNDWAKLTRKPPTYLLTKSQATYPPNMHKHPSEFS